MELKGSDQKVMDSLALAPGVVTASPPTARRASTTESAKSGVFSRGRTAPTKGRQRVKSRAGSECCTVAPRKPEKLQYICLLVRQAIFSPEMARQFTTFSVVDILGQEADAEPQNQQTGRTTNEGEPKDSATEEGSYASSVAVGYGQGKIRQMLPPAPAISYSSEVDDDHPFLYTPASELPPRSPPQDQVSPTETDKRQKGRKGKKGTKRSRVSSEVDDQQLVATAGEEIIGDDDVFPPSSNLSRRSRRVGARAVTLLSIPAAAAARGLTSAGETPSPPGEKPTGTKSTNGSNPTPESSKTAPSEQQEELEEEEDGEQPKKKRARTAFTREQLHTMERHFRKTAYPDSQLLKLISSEAHIPIPKLQVWFQNRRAKARKWGQMLPEPSNNSALYRGALPSAESSRYLPPLQPTSVSPRTTPTQETPPRTSPQPPLAASTSLVSSLLTPYQRFYPPPPYPLPSTYPLLPPPPLPYPLSYSLYTGALPATNSSSTAMATALGNFQNSATGSQPVITGDSNKQHL